MQYWEDDAATRVCLLSLDSIGNPRKFSRITRRLTRRKPVVVFAPGRASRAAHVRRTRRARARAGRGGRRPVPPGRGDGGAPARGDDRHRQDRGAAAVARRSAGADRHQLRRPSARRCARPATRSGCSGSASRCCSARSPTRRRSSAAARAALADPGCDSVVCAAVNVFDQGTEDVIMALEEVAVEAAKPLVGVFLDFHPPLMSGGVGRRRRATCPASTLRPTPIHALSALSAYAHWRDRDPGAVPMLEVDEIAARRVVNRVLGRGAGGPRADRSRDGRTARRRTGSPWCRGFAVAHA